MKYTLELDADAVFENRDDLRKVIEKALSEVDNDIVRKLKPALSGIANAVLQHDIFKIKKDGGGIFGSFHPVKKGIKKAIGIDGLGLDFGLAIGEKKMGNDKYRLNVALSVDNIDIREIVERIKAGGIELGDSDEDNMLIREVAASLASNQSPEKMGELVSEILKMDPGLITRLLMWKAKPKIDEYCEGATIAVNTLSLEKSGGR